MIAKLHYEDDAESPGDDPRRILLVMLPGVGSEADEFAVHGFVEAVRDCRAPIDIIAAKPDTDLYLEGTVVRELHDEVVAPALKRRDRRLWLLGISLGGMGALLYAAARAEAVEGLVLLAPFLGTPGTIAELSDAGGFAGWSAAQSRATAGERCMLAWLQDFLARLPLRPMLYLGYGLDDRFARGHALLAESLPRERVAVVQGGHDWNTWAALWGELLDRQPFAPEIGKGR